MATTIQKVYWEIPKTDKSPATGCETNPAMSSLTNPGSCATRLSIPPLSTLGLDTHLPGS